MPSALITGANGFVGSHLCDAFAQAGYQVFGLVRRTSDLRFLKDSQVDLIYGDLKPEDRYNWMTKIRVMAEKASDLFEDYPGGEERFQADFHRFINDPRRFIYSPLIIAKGVKPATG